MVKVAPKLIFLVTEDWYFHMHRLPQARAARDAGFEVCVATRVRAHGDRITAEGFRLIPLQWKRESLGPVSAIKDILEIRRVYRREKPNIVHQVSMKSIVLGTVAGRLTNVPIIVNAFTGLGQLFLGHTAKVKFIRALTLPIMRRAFDSPSVYSIVENSDHRQMLIDQHIVSAERSMVIRGSGVDIDYFTLLPEPPRVPPVIACAARMLRGKGILVLAEAMRILATRSPARLLLAGTTDPDTADSLTDAEMRVIAAEPNIEWLGRIDDVRDLWAARISACCHRSWARGYLLAYWKPPRAGALWSRPTLPDAARSSSPESTACWCRPAAPKPWRTRLKHWRMAMICVWNMEWLRAA